MRRIYTKTSFCHTRRTSKPKEHKNNRGHFCKILTENALKTPKLPPAATPRTRNSKSHVLLETLQSVQSVELFNFKRAPRARERQGTPGSAREAPVVRAQK